jgi:hypothetical protein
VRRRACVADRACGSKVEEIYICEVGVDVVLGRGRDRVHQALVQIVVVREVELASERRKERSDR